MTTAILNGVRELLGALKPVNLPWRFHEGDVAGAQAPEFDDSTWREVPLTASYRFFGQRRLPVVWLRTRVTLPSLLRNDRLKLYLTGDADGKVYVDGLESASFGRNTRWPITVLKNASQEGPYFLAVRFEGLTLRPPDKSTSCFLTFETPRGNEFAEAFRRFQYVEALVERPEAGSALEGFAKQVDFDAAARGDAIAFLGSLRRATRALEPMHRILREYRLHIVPHAHIDLAWFHDSPETKLRTAGIFAGVLALMEESGQATFAQDQAAVYLPFAGRGLMSRIADHVRKGRWDVVGGSYAQADAMIPGGEAMVRQFLYGKRYLKALFNKDVNVAWNLDCFGGHLWTLPQILKKAGIDFYVFKRGASQRLAEFWWQSPDGSRVLGYHLLGGYDSGFRALEGRLRRNFALFVRASAVKEFMLLDGTDFNIPDMATIRNVRALSATKLFPRIGLSTAHAFFSNLDKKANYPVVSYELDPEDFGAPSTGYYTTHGRIKERNRRLEVLLESAEKFGSLARMRGAPYPEAELRRAWELVLWNADHGPVTGTCSHHVSEQVLKGYDEAEHLCDEVIERSLNHLTGQVDTRGDGIPITIWNSLSWGRGGLVDLRLYVPRRIDGEPVVRDANGKTRPVQYEKGVASSPHMISHLWRIRFEAQDVPGLGCKVYWLTFQKRRRAGGLSVSTEQLASQRFRITLDADSGNLSSIHDEKLGRDLLAGGDRATALQVLMDHGTIMPPWVTNLTGEAFDAEKEGPIEVVENGPVCVGLRCQRRFRNSRIAQEVRIYDCAPWIEFTTLLDCHDLNTVWKACFRVASSKGQPTCDIGYGVLPRKRPGPQGAATDPPVAVPPDSIAGTQRGGEWFAQKWMDLADDGWGIALLNKSRYAYDMPDDTTIRLTLLRNVKGAGEATGTDQGRQTISYALLPHKGDWREVVRAGYEFNYPLFAVVDTAHRGNLSHDYSFVGLRPRNVIISALKQAEDSPDLVVRCYETEGRKTTAELTFGGPVRSACEMDLMEWKNAGKVTARSRSVTIQIGPYEIKTLKVRLSRQAVISKLPHRRTSRGKAARKAG